MELILIELLCLTIAGGLVVALLHDDLSGKKVDSSLRSSALAFFLYLTLAITVHFATEGLLTYPSVFLQLMMIGQTNTLLIFISLWSDRLALRPLPTKASKIGRTIRFMVIVAALLYSFFLLAGDRLFTFGPSGKPQGGLGLTIFLALCALITLRGMISLILNRSHFTLFALISIAFSLFFLLISLFFFYTFQRPYLVSLTGTFILVYSYLVWQRHELTLDVMTKIPNYTAFLNRLELLINYKTPKTIFMIDIENFRLINDRYTVHRADQVLIHFAQALAQSTPDENAYRLYGNRFILMMPKLTHNEVVRVVNQVRTLGAVGWIIDGQHISFHMNFAIVEIPLVSNTMEEITESLEFTMAEIKENRRLSVIIFNQRLIPLRNRRLEIVSILRQATIDHSMVKVVYQPIIDAKDNRIIAAEALMRIVDPHRGIISPFEFIPTAERTGLIKDLTAIMVSKVCTFLNEHIHLANNLKYISINISSEDIGSADMVSRVLSIIEKSKVNPAKIVFEVTESMLLKNNEQVRKNWDIFAANGVDFMLDDFGTGYSNLESLLTLPFNFIKLDRSLIANKTNDYQLLALTTTLLKQLGKQMVAEGVETAEQLKIATDHGVTYIQGYYFSKPVDEEQLIEWMGGSMCIVPLHPLTS
ncbi:MAG: bifunctional diguanylate cyclase/phosphodiesterase [Sphaerochaeta sp.]